MRTRAFAFVVAAGSSCCVLASTTHARAQEVVVTGQPQPAPAPPPPGYVPAYPPGYVPVAPGYAPGYATPIYQQTQPSYVPQSVAMSGPPVIRDWSEGEPVPPGYHPISRMRTGLVAGGAVLFGVTYLFSALAAAIASDANPGQANPYSALWVPAAGPFIQMFQPGNGATGSLFLALDGLCQVGGISMFAIGLAAPKTMLVRNDLASSSAPHLALAPILGPGRSGMGLVGTF
jgi:hypothetical protein